MVFKFFKINYIFVLFHYCNRCYCYFKMLYWFFDGNDPTVIVYIDFIYN